MAPTIRISSDSQQIVSKAWNFAHVLRDDGLSYMAYTEQITFLLFLKMADEQTRPPYNKPPIVPARFGWESRRSRNRRAAGYNAIVSPRDVSMPKPPVTACRLRR
jgi:hypothetical protein